MAPSDGFMTHPENCEADAAWQIASVKNISQLYPSNVLYI
jgi:hypothetical protein